MLQQHTGQHSLFGAGAFAFHFLSRSGKVDAQTGDGVWLLSGLPGQVRTPSFLLRCHSLYKDTHPTCRRHCLHHLFPTTHHQPPQQPQQACANDTLSPDQIEEVLSAADAANLPMLYDEVEGRILWPGSEEYEAWAAESPQEAAEDRQVRGCLFLLWCGERVWMCAVACVYACVLKHQPEDASCQVVDRAVCCSPCANFGPHLCLCMCLHICMCVCACQQVMSAAFREEFADVFEDAKQAAQALQEVGTYTL